MFEWYALDLAASSSERTVKTLPQNALETLGLRMTVACNMGSGRDVMLRPQSGEKRSKGDHENEANEYLLSPDIRLNACPHLHRVS